MSNLIGKTLGKYRLGSRIGRGGMSRVYKAYQLKLNRSVAVKVLHSYLADDEEFLLRFEREAAAIGQLRHPNIVQVYDFDHDVELDLYYMVMELVEGHTLRDEILARQESQERFTLDEIVQIFTPLASAVDYAHGQGMVHRDIKPSNIMFSQSGQIILTDFGLVHILGDSHITVTGTVSGTPSYLSPEQARGEKGDARSDIYALGVVLYELVTGRVPFQSEQAHRILVQHASESPPEPSQFHPDISAELEEVILTTLSKEPKDRYQTAADLATALRFACGLPTADRLTSLDYRYLSPRTLSARREDIFSDETRQRLEQRPIGPCPYRGLYAFQEADAEFFYGREPYIDALQNQLEKESLAALIGPSGSGKSSLVFAGLVPRLRQTDHWEITSFRPGKEPFSELARALIVWLEPSLTEEEQRQESHKLARALATRQVGLHEVMNRVRQLVADETKLLLLIIDQFEELYTQESDQETRQQFLKQIVEAAQTNTAVHGRELPALNVLLTLRADFLGQVLDHRPFTDMLQRGTQILGPMTREELTAAVETPAEKQGVLFEEGLVERILEDVGGELGNLPLLEFALTSLWDRQTNGKLTHAAYESIGRVEGALARYADEVIAQLSPAETRRAVLIFVQLVRPGEGTEDTRRVASRAEIGEENWALVQRLADARLVTTNQGAEEHETAELVHEALIHGWGQLRQWVNNTRTFRAWQERLRDEMHQWENVARDAGALLRGAHLAEAEGWLSERPQEIGQSERDYIEASVAWRDQDANQRRTEREARQRLTRLLTAVSVIGFVLMLAIALWALSQRNRAIAAQGDLEEQRLLAESLQATAVAERDLIELSLSRQLALQSRFVADEQLDLALLLAVEAYKTSDTSEARGSLLDGLLREPNLRQYLHGHTDRVQAVAVSPDGKTIATGGSDTTIILWDVATGRPRGEPLTRHFSIVNALAFSHNGRYLASGGNDRQIIIWEIEEEGATATAVLAEQGAMVLDVGFSPNDQLLAAARADGRIVLLSTEDWKGVGEPLVGHEGQATALSFSPTAELLASAGQDGHIVLWDLGLLESRGEPLFGHEAVINAIDFSADGKRLASGGRDSLLLLWDVESGEIISEISDHETWITAITFDPSGSVLATADRNGRIVVRDSENPASIIQNFTTHRNWVSDLAFGPSGSELVSTSFDESAIVWDFTGQETPMPRFVTSIIGHDNWINEVNFSPDGTLLASASREGNVKVWDTSIWGEVITIQHNAAVRSAAFSPNGKTLAYGSEDGSVGFWDIENSQPLGEPIKAHADFVQKVQFSPDGIQLASSGDDEVILIWNVATREPIGKQLLGHEGTIWDLEFLADGETLLSVGRDGKAFFWDLTSFEARPPSFQAHSLPVRALAVHPDGTRFATASDDETIKVWELATGDLLMTLEGHTAEVESLRYSAEGRWLVSASDDKTIIVWDAARGVPIGDLERPLRFHNDWVLTVALDPRGERIVSSGRDGAIAIWDFDPQTWLALSCKRANRNMRSAEWDQFFGGQPLQKSC